MASVSPDPVIAEARRRWNKCNEAEDAQRKAILTAKQFRAGDQWPSAIKIAREGGGAIQGQPPQPPRPCLVVDRLSQPVRQISNTIKNASFGFDVLPNGQGADTETAEIFKGYMRRVQNQSRGESPVEWAADGAIEGGIGWFRIRTEYVHESWDGDPADPEAMDQELRLERITNNLTVYCDPSAMRPTRSDAQFMFITEDMDKEEFKSKYPKADLRGLEEFTATGDMKGWVSQDTIRIAEYWRVTYEETDIWQLEDGSAGIGKPPKDAQVKTQRTIRKPIVKGSKINAVEELEEWDWVGSRIPIIPILGEELNVDGKPVLRGIIAEGMDAQRMVNYTYSGAMEIFALGSKSPYIAAVGQIENYKSIWQTANTYNYSYLPYDPITIAGTMAPPPQRDVSEAPIQAAVMLMRTSEEALKATTSTGDASLGNSNPNERSGRALQALQAQSDLANSNYPDNVRRALIYCAELMVEVIPKITRPGQILNIMGVDDEPQQVIAGQPFKEGPAGVPEAAPPEVTPEIAKMKENLYKFYDLNAGRYAVTVSIGKATATRREEGAAALGELIPHLPPAMAAVATPDFVEQLSFPGAHKIAEKLRKALPPELQDQEQQGAIPPQIQAMVGQLQQQNQQMQQMIQTDQVKQQAAIQQAQIKAQTELQIAQFDAQKEIELQRMKDVNALAVAEIEAQTQSLKISLEAQKATLSLQQQQSKDAMQQQHEREQTEREALQQSALAAQGHEQSLEQQAAQPMAP